jgi:hypothetical protein
VIHIFLQHFFAANVSFNVSLTVLTLLENQRLSHTTLIENSNNVTRKTSKTESSTSNIANTSPQNPETLATISGSTDDKQIYIFEAIGKY